MVEISLVLNEDVYCEQFDYELSEAVRNAKEFNLLSLLN